MSSRHHDDREHSSSRRHHRRHRELNDVSESRHGHESRHRHDEPSSVRTAPPRSSSSAATEKPRTRTEHESVKTSASSKTTDTKTPSTSSRKPETSEPKKTSEPASASKSAATPSTAKSVAATPSTAKSVAAAATAGTAKSAAATAGTAKPTVPTASTAKSAVLTAAGAATAAGARSAASKDPKSQQQQQPGYAQPASTNIFAYEIARCFLQQLETRTNSWIEGLYASVIGDNDSDVPVSASTGLPRYSKDQLDAFYQGLQTVYNWKSDVLRSEIAVLTKMCPNIRDIYKSVIDLYFHLYFFKYPNLDYEVRVPSLTVFLFNYYKALIQDRAVTSIAIRHMYGDQRNIVFENAVRRTLFEVCRESIDKIFMQIQAAAAAKSAAAVIATPEAMANTPNNMFKSVVEKCLKDVETPATKTKVATAAPVAAVAIATAGSSRPAEPPSTKSTKTSSNTADSHRTVILSAAAGSARRSANGRKNSNNSSSDDESGSSYSSYSSYSDDSGSSDDGGHSSRR